MNAPSATPSPSSKPRQALPKTSRILKSSEFRRVYDQGTRYTSRLFAAFCLDTSNPDRATGARIGFTVPRALGKAHTRNRIRRRVREAFRLDFDQLGSRWDIVVNPRRTVLDATFAEVRNEVRKLMSRCKQ